ncbi:ATP-dependent helicase/nuclease subunit A [Mariprofundus micogutta]|uniref:DNA 3'-5' helicase n=1 Tax=Mariprofundus micogutta TaxID=1921010 RepID=A0A1L8CQL5_9PROT|nr:UvrD-helicase domain-containing protein [Mariprofundus micogutta]GAV21187.1 ATP-dependent helicase/nuclease subunit A [Mariprofundus micogutta]
MSESARRQARDPSISCLVQAPAGSGKTELLTQRILALLAIVEEPEEILALTFTRKAAAEMRGRVMQALNMQKPDEKQSHKMETWQLAQAVLQRSQTRQWNLSEHPGRLQLMTLDSLTFALARQLPLLSGLGEMPKPGENLFVLYREAAEAAINLLMRAEPEKAESLLLLLDHQMASLIKLVAEMLAKREQWLPTVAQNLVTSSARHDMQEILARLVLERVEQCNAMIPIEVKDQLPALLVFAAKQDDCTLDIKHLLDLQQWPAVNVESIALWQGIAAGLLKKTGGFPAPASINKARGFPAHAKAEKLQMQEMTALLSSITGLDELLADLIRLPAQPAYSDQQWSLLEALFELLVRANEQLQGLFARQGEADFTEVVLRALQALEDEAGTPSDLLMKLDYRIHHILVDEFQDTSSLQMRLLQNLTAGWQAGDGRHRTLFMVGDPMQSIYRFRKAEVGLFLQAAANEADLPWVESLKLERNFRSAPDIVAWVNRTFANVLPDDDDVVRGAVSHAMAASALHHTGRVKLHVQQGRDDIQEAAAIVALVQQEKSRAGLDGELQRIGILTRSRKQLHAIIPALQEAGIAFRAIKILPLATRPEIRLLRALSRALLHPADSQSWMAILRSVCCGLSSARLFPLLTADKRSVWQLIHDEQRIEAVDADTQLRLAFIKDALGPCVEVAGTVPVHDLLATAWHRLSLPELLDESAEQNVAAALELIESLDEGGQINFALLDERLEELFAAPDSSSEAAQVELLTMHGAKGLQWDVVILPGLGKTGRGADAPLLAFTDVPEAGGVKPLLAPKAEVRGKDAIYSLINSIEKSKYNYELARLLYVACTRAESGLFMYGHVSESTELAANGSFLKLLLADGLEGECFGAEIEICEAGEQIEATEKKALQRMLHIPELVTEQAEQEELETEYFWAGPEAAPVGNAVHEALQHAALIGVEQCGDSFMRSENTSMRNALMAEGLSGPMLETALSRCSRALEQALASDRGSWLLSARHPDARCEWALSVKQEGFIAHYVIDRSFIDEQGIRWVIDYKTASHEGGDLNAFLSEEESRHAPQLQRYTSILKKMQPDRPVKCALYFPMLDAWREIAQPGEDSPVMD